MGLKRSNNQLLSVFLAFSKTQSHRFTKPDCNNLLAFQYSECLHHGQKYIEELDKEYKADLAVPFVIMDLWCAL